MAGNHVLVLFVFVGFLVVSLGSAGPSLTFTQLMRRYDKYEPPKTDKPTTVKIGLYVNSMSVDTSKQVIKMNIYFRSSWLDSRLALPRSQKKLRLFPDQVKSIWTPDLFIRNRDYVTDPDVMSPGVLGIINATGHVWFVKRYTLGVWCPGLKASNEKSCTIMFESFGYKSDTLLIKRMGSRGFDFDKEGIRSPHLITKVDWKDCSQKYSSGTYPCLKLIIKLKNA